MGCDIHAHIEVKIAGEWHYYSPVELQRSYITFAKMANVRNYDKIEPIVEPKGLPNDIAFMTRFHYNRLGDDGHSHSWFSMKEMAALFEFFDENNLYPWKDSRDFHWNQLGVWVCGNSIGGFAKYPEEYDGIEDIRLVFWFDN